MNDFKIKRSEGVIHYHTSGFWNIPENYIQIWSDEGRLIRPLLKVNDIMWRIRKLYCLPLNF